MKYTLLLLTLFLIGCTGNHYHDGIYVKGLGLTNSFKNEVLRVSGNEIYSQKYSYEGTFQGETKVICEQHPDKIEFQEAGMTRVISVQADSSLKLSDEQVFVRFGDLTDSFTVKSKKTEPLIKINDNGTITILPTEKEKHLPKPKVLITEKKIN